MVLQAQLEQLACQELLGLQALQALWVTRATLAPVVQKVPQARKVSQE